MIKFSKKTGSFLFWIVGLLGLSYLFQDQISTTATLSISAIILVAGFTYLIIKHVSELENEIKEIKKSFIREKVLKNMMSDLKALKLTMLNKK